MKKFHRYLARRSIGDSIVFFLSLSCAFLRGLLRGYPFVFIGPHVIIRSRSSVRIGHFTRIEAFVEIDGFSQAGIDIGRHCKIGKYSIVKCPPTPIVKGHSIAIGDNTAFAEFCFIGGAGCVQIGQHNSFGQYCSLHPQDHVQVGSSDLGGAARTREVGIQIGSGNWFGAKVTVLDGTQVGDRNTFGATSVLRGRFGDGVIAVGVPAKVIKRHD